MDPLLILAELAGAYGVNIIAARLYELWGKLSLATRKRILRDLKKILKRPELKSFKIPSSKKKKPVIIAFLVSIFYDDEKVSDYNENRNNLIEWMRVNLYTPDMAERFTDALENAAKNYYSTRVDPGIREMTRQFNAKQSETLKEIISNQENLRALIEEGESGIRNTISNIYNITLNAGTVNMQIGGTTNIFYYTETKITGSRQIDFTNYLKSIINDKLLSQIPMFYVNTDVEHMKRTEIELWAQLVPEREETPEGSANIDKDAGERKKEPVLSAIQRRKKEHLLLCGKPGSGKTTTLYRYMLILVGEALKNHSYPVPVLVELKKKKCVIEIIRDFFIKYGLALSEEVIESLLLSRKFCLLMDGLNEIPSDNERKRLSDFLDTYGKYTSIVFTSRIVGGMPGINFNNKFEMLPLTPKQVEEFVKKSLPVTSGELLRKIGIRIKKITDNPLLLRILCDIYYRKEEIPGNLADLFRMFTEDYMKKFKGDPPVDCPVKDKWDDMLSRIAFKMINGDGGTEFNLEMKKSEAEDIIRGYICNNLKAPGIAHKAGCCLNDLIDHHLLTDAGDGKIGFFHQLILEYYSSLQLETFIPDLPGEEIKRKYLNYQKWTEPLRLMLEISKDQEKGFNIVKLSFEVDYFLSAYLSGSSDSLFNGKYLELLKPVADNKLLFIDTLRRSGSEGALEPLIALLKDKCKDIRICAAIALGEIGSDKAIGPMIPLLRGKGYNVFESATMALKKIGSEAAIRALEPPFPPDGEDFIYSRKTVLALGEIGFERTVKLLTIQLKDKDSFVHREAVEAIGKIGSEAAIEQLIPLLKDEDSSIRWSVTRVLGEIGSEAAIEQLIPLLKDEDSSIRWSVTRVLGEIGSEAAIELLIPLLKDEDSSVRSSVAGALGEIGSEKAIEQLIPLLKDEDSSIRTSAYWALSKCGNLDLLKQFKQVLTATSKYNIEVVFVVSSLQDKFQIYDPELL